MADYTSAFEKPFTDITKLLIGILLSILPLINWFAYGFILKCSGVGKAKPSKKMPEWKNFGDLFAKGFFNFAISLVYFLPALIFFMLGAGSVMVSVLSSIQWEQLAEKSSEEMAAIIQPVLESALPSIAVAIPFIIAAAILFMIALYVLPIAVLSYLENEKFADAFRLGKIFKKAFTGGYFVVWILMALFGIMLNWMLDFIPVIGSPAAAFIAGVISFSLFGQIYSEKSRIKKK